MELLNPPSLASLPGPSFVIQIICPNKGCKLNDIMGVGDMGNVSTAVIGNGATAMIK